MLLLNQLQLILRSQIQIFWIAMGYSFLSIYFRRQLRECVGSIKSDQPLYEVTAQMVVSAAANDPRFSTVSVDEINELKIELSVLTPLQLVTNINQIKIGQHGFYIVNGRQNGLLLPQVAISHHLKILKQTCLKAGLPDNAWQFNKTEIYVFRAEVFIRQFIFQTLSILILIFTQGDDGQWSQLD